MCHFCFAYESESLLDTNARTVCSCQKTETVLLNIKDDFTAVFPHVTTWSSNAKRKTDLKWNGSTDILFHIRELSRWAGLKLDTQNQLYFGSGCAHPVSFVFEPENFLYISVPCWMEQADGKICITVTEKTNPQAWCCQVAQLRRLDSSNGFHWIQWEFALN